MVGDYKLHLYTCRTPAGLDTFSWGWGLPTLARLCKALPNVEQVLRPTGVWHKGILELNPICSDTCRCVYIYIYIYIHLSLSLSLHISISISLSLYIYVYMYMYVYIYIYIYIPKGLQQERGGQPVRLRVRRRPFRLRVHRRRVRAEATRLNYVLSGASLQLLLRSSRAPAYAPAPAPAPARASALAPAPATTLSPASCSCQCRGRRLWRVNV